MANSDPCPLEEPSINGKDRNMTRVKLAALTLMGCALGLFASVDGNRVSSVSGNTTSLEVSISKAHAARRGGGHRRAHARRTTRRVARRTTHRVVRRAVLPRSCRWRAPYHYCGGVYYQPYDGGYVVVYP